MPAESKAKELYANAVAKSRELGIYNDCASKALAGLKKYDPANFGDVPETVVPVAPSATPSAMPAGLLAKVDTAPSAAAAPPPAAGTAAPAPAATPAAQDSSPQPAPAAADTPPADNAAPPPPPAPEEAAPSAPPTAAPPASTDQEPTN
jgi:hypothetical protein